MTSEENNNCTFCGSEKIQLLQKIESRPAVEVDYGISQSDYYREIYRCGNCAIFFNKWSNLIPDDFYSGSYNKSIDEGSLLKRFNSIINFPFHLSDNKNRTLRIINFLYENNYRLNESKLLDIGSGTSVFLYEMKKFGFKIYSLDPDSKSTYISEKIVKVEKAFTGNFENTSIEECFDIITFNKVLEHISDPISVLLDSKKYLNKSGIIYIELPDGTEIAKKSAFKKHAEFNLEHLFIFNIESLSFLAKKADMNILKIDRIKDPSGKHTIYCFLENQVKES